MNPRGTVHEILNSEHGKKHVAQIQQMSLRAKHWRKRNPKVIPLVTFNFPQNCQVIGDINTAIEQGFVTANQAGLNMIEAMHGEGDEAEPTVAMVQIALSL